MRFLSGLIERGLATLRRRRHRRAGGRVWIETYGGLGGPGGTTLRGRVLAGDRPSSVRARRSAWRNLRDLVRRMAAPGVEDVEVEEVSSATVARTDRDGYFVLRPRTDGPGPLEVRIARAGNDGPGPHEPVRAETGVARPGPASRFVVVSDVDDTLLPQAAFGWLTATFRILFSNVATRSPFPGVAEFYRGLQDGPSGDDRNLLVYLSSSPWNLHGLLHEFMRQSGIPVDALLLRNWTNELFPRHHDEHKRGHLDAILALYPDLRLILLGDSSARDPEIYHGVVRDHPGRVAAVYIRDVKRRRRGREDEIRGLAEDARAVGTELVLARDTVTMAEHAARHGWIDAASCEAVRAAQDA